MKNKQISTSENTLDLIGSTVETNLNSKAIVVENITDNHDKHYDDSVNLGPNLKDAFGVGQVTCLVLDLEDNDSVSEDDDNPYIMLGSNEYGLKNYLINDISCVAQCSEDADQVFGKTVSKANYVEPNSFDEINYSPEEEHVVTLDNQKQEGYFEDCSLYIERNIDEALDDAKTFIKNEIDEVAELAKQAVKNAEVILEYAIDGMAQITKDVVDDKVNDLETQVHNLADIAREKIKQSGIDQNIIDHNAIDRSENDAIKNDHGNFTEYSIQVVGSSGDITHHDMLNAADTLHDV